MSKSTPAPPLPASVVQNVPSLNQIRIKNLLLAILIMGLLILLATYSNVISFEPDEAGDQNNLRYSPMSANETMREGLLPPIAEAKKRSSLPNTAFAFLALGAQANQMNCPAAIESLVRHSGWDGDVYLLTDQEQCFHEETIVRNAGMKKEKFHYVVVDEKFSTGGIDVFHPKIGFRQARVRSLSMKTRLFEFIQDPNVKVVAFADCDILFAQEGCAQDFAQAGPSWSEVGIKFSRLFYDPDNGELRDIHAGTFVVHREHSKDVLDSWRKQIELGQDEGDNDAYMELYRTHNVQHHVETMPKAQWPVVKPGSKTSKGGKAAIDSYPHLTGKNPMLPGEAVKHTYLEDKEYAGYGSLILAGPSIPHVKGKPTTVADFYHELTNTQDKVDYLAVGTNNFNGGIWYEKYHYEKFFHPLSTLPMHDPQHKAAYVEQRCMNHISKARCATYGRELVQEYVNRYQLRTYEGGKYQYCVAPALQTLLYGWFPFGYLPFCPKIEKYL